MSAIGSCAHAKKRSVVVVVVVVPRRTKPAHFLLAARLPDARRSTRGGGLHGTLAAWSRACPHGARDRRHPLGLVVTVVTVVTVVLVRVGAAPLGARELVVVVVIIFAGGCSAFILGRAG